MNRPPLPCVGRYELDMMNIIQQRHQCLGHFFIKHLPVPALRIGTCIHSLINHHRSSFLNSLVKTSSKKGKNKIFLLKPDSWPLGCLVVKDSCRM